MEKHMGEKYNLTYFSPKVEKRKSAIDGRGLFAREDISSGDVVVVKGGYVLTRAQRDQVGTLLGPSEIQITEDLFIGPTTRREREGGTLPLPPMGGEGCWLGAVAASLSANSIALPRWAAASLKAERRKAWSPALTARSADKGRTLVGRCRHRQIHERRAVIRTALRFFRANPEFQALSEAPSPPPRTACL